VTEPTAPARRSERKPERKPFRKAIVDALIPDFLDDRDEQVVYPPDPLDERDYMPPVASPHKVSRVPGADVKKNTFEVLLFRGLSTPLSFLIVVLQSRVLEPTGRGTFVLAVLTVTIFTRLLGDLGTATTNQVTAEAEDLGAVTASALRLSLAFGIVCSLLVITVGPLASDIGVETALFAALALTPSLVVRTLSGVLLGTANIRAWNWLQILPTFVSFAGFLVLCVLFDFGVRGAVISWTLGHVAAALVGLVLTRRIWLGWLARRRPRGRALRLFWLAISMGAASVITLLNYRIELFILGRYEDLDQVGVYSNAVQVAESLWLVSTALATAVLAPAIHETEERAASLVARSAGKALLFITGAGVVLFAIAPWLVPLIFGDKFEDSVRPVQLLLPGIVLYGPVAILTIYISVRKGRALLTLAGPVVSLVVTVALALLLIPDRGAEGAAVASSVGYAVSAVVVGLVFVRLAGLGWLSSRPATT
jgi:O-antigen/teichoic acid export membrane protein